MNPNSSTLSAASATSLTTVDSTRRWSLAARLTAWYTGSAFVLILATTGFLYWSVTTILDHEDDHFLIHKSEMLLEMMREHHDDPRELRDEIERESGPRTTGQLLLRLFGPTGQVIAETPGINDQLPSDKFPPIHREAELRSFGEFRSSSGKEYRVLSTKSPDHRTVQVAMDRTAEEKLLADYRVYVAIVLIVALLLCAVAGYGLAKRALRPLNDMAQATRRIRSSTLHERIDRVNLPGELAELAATFNDMLDRLEDSFQRLERFSADIAHELRTPVNNLRGEAEVALGQPRSPEQYREVLTSGLEEYGRLTGLIDSLLFLARAESPRAQIHRERLDIARKLAAIREYYEPAANEAGVEFAITTEPDLFLELDRTLFQRAISNLVANALANTPAGGQVMLIAKGNIDSVVIEIADTGRGIAPEHLPHVFDRFYRADPARESKSGSVGLGLALVKSIVALHGGQCFIESELGRGTCLRLVFPRMAH